MLHNVFCDLIITVQDALERGYLTPEEKVTVATCIAASVQCATFMGRVKEWKIMLRKSTLEELVRNPDKLVCGRHKTAKYYGSVAKYIPDALNKALKLYASLPGQVPT